MELPLLMINLREYISVVFFKHSKHFRFKEEHSEAAYLYRLLSSSFHSKEDHSEAYDSPSYSEEITFRS